ncbi:MAG: DsrE family protein [Anaerolineales bacterium]|nr:DsrE family protein [Anaerolineales bacterium]
MPPSPAPSSTIILVTNEGMGHADLSLQHKLISTYFTLLVEHELLPAAICFYTSGVKLVANGSPVLEQLKTLEGRGVRLIACNTCLGYYGLNEQLAVGIAGGMTDILEAQWAADKVISI